MKEIIVHSDPGSRYLARLAEQERAVDRLDAESVLRHFITTYDRADRDRAGGTHEDGTPFFVVESMWLRNAAAIARQHIADVDQMARIEEMQQRRAAVEE